MFELAQRPAREGSESAPALELLGERAQVVRRVHVERERQERLDCVAQAGALRLLDVTAQAIRPERRLESVRERDEEAVGSASVPVGHHGHADLGLLAALEKPGHLDRIEQGVARCHRTRSNPAATA